WEEQVAAIDVSGYASRKQLVIVTQRGGRIVWGGAINEAIPGQVPAEVRLKRLEVLQRQYGAIDARHRVVEVAGPRTLVDDSATADASGTPMRAARHRSRRRFRPPRPCPLGIRPPRRPHSHRHSRRP